LSWTRRLAKKTIFVQPLNKLAPSREIPGELCVPDSPDRRRSTVNHVYIQHDSFSMPVNYNFLRVSTPSDDGFGVSCTDSHANTPSSTGERASMRVLHVCKAGYHQRPGGIENAVRQMVVSASHRGIGSTVLCIDGGKASRGGECPSSVIVCPPSVSVDSVVFSRAMFGRFSCLAKTHDLIHYHFPFPQQDILHLWNRPAIPSVVTYHSDIVRQRILYRLYRPLLTRFLSSVDAVVATSDNYLDSSPVLRQYRDKVSVIPLGLDETTYPPADASSVSGWEARVGRDFFLFVGVLRYYKGLDVLLQAAARTRRRFVIAGAGPMERRLRAEAARLNLDNVLFVGCISEQDKAALFALCRALVFPSHVRSEAFGLSLVEGAMFGRPLISCEIGTGTSFVNRHNHTGLVVEKASPDALREAVETVAENDRMAEIFGQNARKHYLEHFTAQLLAERYAGLYGRVAGISAGAFR